MSLKKGITIAGNILADYVKIIDVYPEKNMLTNIRDIKTGVGGCAPNTAVTLACIDKTIPIKVVGRVGRDANADFVIDRLKQEGIDTSGVVKSSLPTSFTDVMTESGSGARTFFHMRGANSEFCIDDIDIDGLDCDIFHIGYILLLDSLDLADGEYGTKMARLLHLLQQRGIKTSVDVVSEEGERFKSVVRPALKYCDYLIINETEAGKIADISPRDSSGNIDEGNIRQILKFLIESGVREKAVIHCPESGYCMDGGFNFTEAKSCCLPKGYIKGSVGAGDAFCAGALYGIYNDYSDKEMLEFAALSAAACLSASDSVGGARSKEKLLKLKIELDV